MMTIPIVTAILGVIIHVLGLLDFIPHSSLMTEFVMFSIDSLVVYGLLKNRKWGYFLAICLYLQQSIMQPYWSYQKYLTEFYVIHPIEYFVAPILVMVSLIICIIHKNRIEIQK